MNGIHKQQTKEDLEYRIEALAERIGCHPDIIYGKVVDLLNDKEPKEPIEKD